MCSKVMATIFIGVALVLAIVVTVAVKLPQPGPVLNHVMAITRFFDVMIPVLAVGALIKYILCCGQCSKNDQDVCGKKD